MEGKTIQVPEDFVKNVIDMLTAQREYFIHQTQSKLIAAKKIEKIVKSQARTLYRQMQKETQAVQSDQRQLELWERGVEL